MHEFFCLNVDDGDVLLAAAMASTVADLTNQEAVLFVNAVPHFAKYVQNVNFRNEIDGELWREARRGRKIHQGIIDGKNNLWIGHHRNHYVKDPSDPLLAAEAIINEYIISCGLRKRVTKAKFLNFIDVCPSHLDTPKSFFPTRVCLLPSVDKTTVATLLSSCDVYGFYNAHLHKRNAIVPDDDQRWTQAVIESDVIVTCEPMSLLFFLPHLQQKKILFLDCPGIKGISSEYIETANIQELIHRIREVNS